MSLNVVTCSRTQFAEFEPEAGQVVIITDEDGKSNDVQMWTGTEWETIKMDTSSEITMTTYDMNKQLIHQLPDLNREELALKREMISAFCDEVDNVFYMLLCKDTNYYTLFHRTKEAGLDHIADIVTECAETQGAIKSIERADGAIEIWVDNPYFEDSTYVMYFFPYDGGVEACR